MGFLSRFLGGEKPRAKLSPEEEAAKEAAFQKARANTGYKDPTGNLDLNLTADGHIDATGQLPNAGYVAPKKEAEARTHFSQTADPTGGSPLKLTPDGEVDITGYQIDAGTKDVLDQFKLAQADARINGAPKEQVSAPKTVQPTVKAGVATAKPDIL
jgi:hypothetical protein